MQIQLNGNFSGLEVAALQKAGWGLSKIPDYHGCPIPLKEFETVREAILEVEEVLKADVLDRSIGFMTNQPLQGDYVHGGDDVWYNHSGHEQILPLLYPGTPKNTREAYAKLYSLLPEEEKAEWDYKPKDHGG